MSDVARAAEALLLREARLLDERRFEDWLALYTDDARYWVPSTPDQADARETVSIIHEDRALLALRIARLAHPRAYSLTPMPRTVHAVSNIELVEERDDGLEVASVLRMTEHREQRSREYAARVHHTLRRVDGALRIAFKRVDLIDCDAVHAVMSIPF